MKEFFYSQKFILKYRSDFVNFAGGKIFILIKSLLYAEVKNIVRL